MGDASSPPPISTASKPSGLPSPNPTKSFWQTSHPNSIAHHRSTSSLPSKAAIVVIGTGVSGTFATRELLTKSDELDLDILVLEARTVCSAATGRNGGHLQPLILSERSGIIGFELANFHYVEGLVAANDIECDFRKVPGCLGFWNKTFFEEAKAALGQDADTGMDFNHTDLVRVVEDAEELKELRLVDAVGAFVQNIAASLSPYKLVVWTWKDMLSRFPPSRLNLQAETAVTELSRSGDEWLLYTSRGTVHAKHVVLTTNAYTSHLLPQFASLISPVQAQMSALVLPKTSPFAKRLIPKSYGFMGVGSQDRVMSDYLVQNPILPDSDGKRSGGHLMFGGGRHHVPGHGVGVSDDDFVDPHAELYLRSLSERLDLISPMTESAPEPQSQKKPLLEIVASWTGIIGSSADGHPWVGAVPDMPGLFLCGGYTGHGMTNAPLCSRHIARLVLESVRGRSKLEYKASEDCAGGIGVPREYVLTRERMERLLAMKAQ
ncbi:uncharacterized protein Z518_00868 [Rhinocladiella mackenziei CBS 650.93]|uniref:FAD dependent oxidoreductase domain-containing protein n=1 Tax=Rhinocladiella mackenziei CBS 650.93 TaxID=1442369 RepID=A0A0D2G4X2_9EURO|nr:uncharacterized protein Z518_00868 [Rhinocladiella mackenziei CBS 650.93]KIX09787.1 hypothetical protein Z518_00868 [Rhinocladiella mackenziei CBS 650.93]